MTIENSNILIADEGMWLRKGDAWSKKVYLGRLDSAENWQEATDEEHEAYLAEQEKAADTAEAAGVEEAATATDGE